MATRYPVQWNYIRPTFLLHKICRQMYVETSPLIYTLNTFTFNNVDTMDRWIKDRAPGQLRLVTSVDVPMEYMRLYHLGFRKKFCAKFPGIKRIGVDILVPYFSRYMSETLEESKARILRKIKEWEGEHVEVEWHWGPNGRPSALRYE